MLMCCCFPLLLQLHLFSSGDEMIDVMSPGRRSMSVPEIIGALLPCEMVTVEM